MVQRSFGAFTSTRGRPSTDQMRTGERRRLTLPRRRRTRATVVRLGALGPSFRASTWEIFCGPKLGWRPLSSRMLTTISSPVANGLEAGRRLCSTSPR